MIRRIILEGDDDAALVDQLRAKAVELGFTVVSDTATDEQGGVRISSHLRLDEYDRRTLTRAGIRYLSDLSALTAYQAWQRIGPNWLFTRMCDLMIDHEYSFADISPANFDRRKGTAWQDAHGIPSRPAYVLASSQVLDTHILMAMTDTEIEDLRNAGPKWQAIIKEIRDQLRG